MQLEVGPNALRVVVTARDGEHRWETRAVLTRLAAESDSLLVGLSLAAVAAGGEAAGGWELQPPFSRSARSYRCAVFAGRGYSCVSPSAVSSATRHSFRRATMETWCSWQRGPRPQLPIADTHGCL